MSSDSLARSEPSHAVGAPVVDLHAHPSLKASLFDRVLTSRFAASCSFDPFGVRTDFPKLRQGALDVLFSVAYAPELGLLRECPILRMLRYLMPLKWRKIRSMTPFETTMEMLDVMERAVADSGQTGTGRPWAKMARSQRELDDILSEGDEAPIAVIHCVEGAHSLDGDLSNVQCLFDRGVAYLTLAHFFENEAVHPCFPYPESVQRLGCYQGERNPALGLKEFGEEVVENCVGLGMMLDVAHSTMPARRRIYEIVGNRAPIIASHVGAYRLNPNPYNLRDWEVRRIAESGGLVGVIFMNYWLAPHQSKRGLDSIARTIEHFVNVGGIDVVAIGSDFDGFTDPPDDIKDASELPQLTQRLVAEGYTREDIDRIWGGNAYRLLREGWGKKE